MTVEQRVTGENSSHSSTTSKVAYPSRYNRKSWPGRCITSLAVLAALVFVDPNSVQAQQSVAGVTVAGVTDGALSIDASGAASFSIPIAVPPGVAGMQPDLSLNYSSHGDNDILGVGWFLSGISIIHRCPKTLVQDDVVGGVNLDAEDRFCLDGQRLVAISGAYGANGTEYRTEIDSLSRITSYGTAGTGPESFLVETKAGQVMEYGATADSRVEADGITTVRFWALNRVSDTVGNYMDLDYDEDTVNQTFKIDRIDYAGNTTAGTTPQSRVQFVYEDRPDKTSFFQAGSRLATNERLSAIETYDGATLVRQYLVSYDVSGPTKRSRVVSITECDGGNNCLNPIEFDFQPDSSGSTEASTAALPSDLFNANGDPVALLSDVNGDGLLDVVRAVGNSRTTWLNTGSGWQEDLDYKAPAAVFAYDNVSLEGRQNAYFIDLNGDGLVDFLQSVKVESTSYRRAWLNTGSGWSEDAEYAPPFDQSEHFTYIEYVRGDRDTGTTRVIHRFSRENGALIDVNGDGLVDQISAKGTLKKTWLNTGSGWQESAEYEPPFDIYVYGGVSPNGRENGDFLDVNGDGLPDFVRAVRLNNASYRTTWLNTGNGWQESADHQPVFDASYHWRTSQRVCEGSGRDKICWTEFHYHSRPEGTYIDANGDGALDFIRAVNGSRTTWLNTGKGWEASAAHQVPFNISNSWTEYEHICRESRSCSREAFTRTRRSGSFADVNGDGLLDFVQAVNDRGASYKTTWLNTANGWEVSAAHQTPYDFIRYWNVTETVCFGDADDKICRPQTTRENGQFGGVSDIDGDGVDDFLRAAGGIRTTWLGNLAAPDHVVGLSDSLGRQTTLAYASLTDVAVYTKGSGAVFPEQDLQGPMHVVAEMAGDDGVGGQSQTKYSYEAARLHGQGRGFLGFARMVAVNETTGIETVTDYRQDHPFIGQVAKTETRLADGTFVRRATDTWEQRPLNTGLTTLIFISQSQAESFEINDGPGNLPFVTVTTTNLYDDFSNPTSMVVATSGGGETFTKTTTNAYTNDTVNWLLGRLTRATVKSELPDLSSETRVSAFGYDPVTGLLNQEVIEPELPSFTLTTNYSRDAFGNVTSKTVSGTGIEARTSSTVFSPDGRFSITATNALGHSENREFDARYGTVTSLSGPNQITTTSEYDGFGRKIREVRADGTETTLSYELCAAQCPAGAVQAVVQQVLITASQTPAGPRSVEYFDSYNRAFRGETEGFDGNRVFVDTEFNARGEAVARTRPYFEGAAAGDIQKVITTYDEVGRPLTVTQPDGGVTTNSYDGLTTTSTNALNQTEVRRNNAIEQLVEVTDNLGTKVTYLYDPFGNLEVTDAGGTVTTLSYDIRGRKTSMDDPDMGVWFYDYNVLDELTLQTDAKNQSVRLYYDKLGRMIQRVENEGTTDWTYDTAAKGIGKLHTVSAPHIAYLETQSYDSLGRTSAFTKTIDGVSYSASVTYDAAGRVETQSYPSGFTVRNSYNSRGYLTSVSEDAGTTVYWQADSVNAEGQVTRETFGNGVEGLRAYDPKTGRVDTIQALYGATILQDLAFDFDKVGNLKKRSDLRQDREEISFYDGLNRLTTTTLTDSGAGGGTLATTTLTYDTIGNIQTKSDVGIYVYGSNGAGPHAVTEAGGETYAYDANGNMISGAGRSVAWSSFNKPILVSETATGDQAGFTYGPDRARIKQHSVKNSIARDIVYVGAYERRIQFGSPDELVHYISAGGTVAIYTAYDDDLPVTNKTRYLHRDHLGSVDTITAESSAVVARLSFDPHGKRRLEDWQAGDPVSPDAETPRGFTGHEHLDSVGLIHMNGRVYDPTLGRFLSADPFVQFPESTQGFNRYAYVNNNPLSYTDPSGFFIDFGDIADGFKSIGKKAFDLVKKIGKVHLSIARAHFDPYYQHKVTMEALQNKYARIAIQIGLVFVPGPWAILASAAYAAAVTIANGGSIVDGLIAAGFAAGSAAAFYGMGQVAKLESFQAMHPVAQHTMKTVAHGIVKASFTSAQSGKFDPGALAGGAFANLVGPLAGGYRTAVFRVAASAAAGGVGAKLGGSKFKNGAISGAFARLSSELPTLAQGLISSNAYDDVSLERKLGSLMIDFAKDTLTTLGKAWTSPNTAVGLLAGFAAVPFGAKVTLGNNAIQFENYPLGSGALTLGNTVLYATGLSPSQKSNPYVWHPQVVLGLHEAGHTYQYEALGPLFIPIYFASGGIDGDNPFEKAATVFAGGKINRPWGK